MKWKGEKEAVGFFTGALCRGGSQSGLGKEENVSQQNSDQGRGVWYVTITREGGLWGEEIKKNETVC